MSNLTRTALLVLLLSPALAAQYVPSTLAAGQQHGGGGSGFTVVQHKFNDTLSSATTIAVTITSTSAGNLILACIGNTGFGTSSTSVVDNASGGSNNYTEYVASLGTHSGANTRSECWYTLNAAHGGATTVTATWGVNVTYRSIEVWEVHRTTGSWATDTANSTINTSGSGTTLSGASVTTSGSPGFIVGYAVPADAITQSPKAGTAFTSGGDITAFGTGACSLVTASSGTFQPQWVDGTSGDNFASSTAAFQ